MNFLIKNCCKIMHQTSEYRKSDGIMPGYSPEKWQINNHTFFLIFQVAYFILHTIKCLLSGNSKSGFN